jgi:uncharacterized protein (TIGR02271 family)
MPLRVRTPLDRWTGHVWFGCQRPDSYSSPILIAIITADSRLRRMEGMVERLDRADHEGKSAHRSLTMTTTVIGLFDNFSEAQGVAQTFAEHGFPREAISLVANREQTSVGEAAATEARGMSVDVGPASRGQPAALIELGVPEDDAQQYAEGIRRGGALVTVAAPDAQADQALELMARYTAVNLEARVAQWRQRGWTGYDPQAQPYTAAEVAQERALDRALVREAGETVIPVVEETLQVGTRRVRRGGVRLYTRVTETPVEQEVRLREEHVRVERHPVERPATEADLAAITEGIIEVTATAEEPVVSRHARVVEEVVVSTDVEERTETVRDTVRHTEVDVERVGAAPARDVRGAEVYEADFRRHYTTSLAGRGHPYERWAPGYRYGYELANDPRYAGHDWPAIEPEARRDWEAGHQGTWDEFKDTIRYAWDTVRGRR